MKGRTLSLIVAILALIIGTMACAINLGGPTAPATVPISTEAVTQMQDQLATADAQVTESGKLTLTLTESQVTSYLADQLAQQQTPLLTHPTVLLRDGTIQIYGVATQGPVSANVKIVVTISVDSQNQPSITLTEADFGPFPVPPSLKDMVTNQIRDAYASALGSAVTHFKLESVNVADGVLTMTGTVQ